MTAWCSLSFNYSRGHQATVKAWSFKRVNLLPNAQEECSFLHLLIHWIWILHILSGNKCGDRSIVRGWLIGFKFWLTFEKPQIWLLLLNGGNKPPGKKLQYCSHPVRQLRKVSPLCPLNKTHFSCFCTLPACLFSGDTVKCALMACTRKLLLTWISG